MSLFSPAVQSAILSSRVGEEIFLYDPAEERYFHLNSTAAAVWERLTEPKTASDLASDLVEFYEVDIETCSSSVTSVLNYLLDSNLIVMNDMPPD